MSLQRLISHCVGLSLTLVFALPESAPAEPVSAASPSTAEEFGKIQRNLAEGMGQLEAANKRLKELSELLAQTANACRRVEDAGKDVQTTREKAVDAAQKTHAVLPESGQFAGLQNLQMQAEDAYSKAQIHLEIERASMAKHVTTLQEQLQSWKSAEPAAPFTASVAVQTSQTIELAIQAVQRMLDAKPAAPAAPEAANETPKPTGVPKSSPAAQPAAASPAPSTSKAPAPAATPSLPASAGGTSPGEQYLQRQVDPFFVQPLVNAIPFAEHFSDFALNPPLSFASDAGADQSGDECFVLDYRFPGPARFPLPVAGLYGECLEEQGAVVYEGMRLAIRPDGRYQVRFTVGTPAMPVTMQLQFELIDRCTGEPYTLTLPPISIPREAKLTGSAVRVPIQPVAVNVQTIHHEGYFAAFDPTFVSDGLQVARRTGTARFGYGVNVP